MYSKKKNSFTFKKIIQMCKLACMQELRKMFYIVTSHDIFTIIKFLI